MEFKHPVQVFLEGSTVKGVPKIVKSKAIKIKVLWAFGLVLGLACGGYQLITLIITYCSYQTSVTQLESKELAPFPDITVCNLQVSDKTFENFDMTFSGYLYVLKYMIDELNGTNTTVGDEDYLNEPQVSTDSKDILLSLYSKPGYFQNIGSNFSELLREQFILECSLNLWDWAHDEPYVKELRDKGVKFKCSDYKFRKYVGVDFINSHFNPMYGTCFTFSLGQNAHKLLNSVQGFSTILYLDDMWVENIYDYTHHVNDNYASGVRVLIHEHGTLPDMSRGFSVAPGQETTVRLFPRERIRMPAPYGECITNSTLYRAGEGTKYTYSSLACASLCVQEEVRKECDCLDPWKLLYPDMLKAHKFCGHVYFNDTALTVSRMRCAQHVINSMRSCSQSNCPSKCEEYMYGMDVHQVPWPNSHHIFGLYQNYIYPNEILRDKFDFYTEIGKQIEEAWIKEDWKAFVDATIKVRSTDLIHRNFVNLKITLDSFETSKERDQPAVTPAQFAGTVGGILNLWIGISFVTIIELLELLLGIIARKLSPTKVTNVNCQN